MCLASWAVPALLEGAPQRPPIVGAVCITRAEACSGRAAWRVLDCEGGRQHHSLECIRALEDLRV